MALQKGPYLRDKKRRGKHGLGEQNVILSQNSSIVQSSITTATHVCVP